MGKGWKRESARHGLARKGIKTALADEQKKARWLATNRKTGKKTIIELARASPNDADRYAKMSNKELLKEFNESDYLQNVIGQTSVMDAQLYDLIEMEIGKRGLDDKAEQIVEKNERRADRMAERGEL